MSKQANDGKCRKCGNPEGYDNFVRDYPPFCCCGKCGEPEIPTVVPQDAPKCNKCGTIKVEPEEGAGFLECPVCRVSKNAFVPQVVPVPPSTSGEGQIEKQETLIGGRMYYGCNAEHIKALQDSRRELLDALHEAQNKIDASAISTRSEEVGRLIKAAQGILPTCHNCGAVTDKYVDENGPYCSLKCWNEAAGDDETEDSFLETYDPVTVLIAALLPFQGVKP